MITRIAIDWFPVTKIESRPRIQGPRIQPATNRTGTLTQIFPFPTHVKSRFAVRTTLHSFFYSALLSCYLFPNSRNGLWRLFRLFRVQRLRRTFYSNICATQNWSNSILSYSHRPLITEVRHSISSPC